MVSQGQTKKKNMISSFRMFAVLVVASGLSACATVDMTAMTSLSSGDQAYSDTSKLSPVSDQAANMKTVFADRGWTGEENRNMFQSATRLLMKGRSADAEPVQTGYVFKDIVKFEADLVSATRTVQQVNSVSLSFLEADAKDLGWVTEAKYLEKALIVGRKAEAGFSKVQAEDGNERTQALMAEFSQTVDALRDVTNTYGNLAWESAPRAASGKS